MGVLKAGQKKKKINGTEEIKAENRIVLYVCCKTAFWCHGDTHGCSTSIMKKQKNPSPHVPAEDHSHPGLLTGCLSKYCNKTFGGDLCLLFLFFWSLVLTLTCVSLSVCLLPFDYLILTGVSIVPLSLGPFDLIALHSGVIAKVWFFFHVRALVLGLNIELWRRKEKQCPGPTLSLPHFDRMDQRGSEGAKNHSKHVSKGSTHTREQSRRDKNFKIKQEMQGAAQMLLQVTSSQRPECVSHRWLRSHFRGYVCIRSKDK